MNREQRRIKSKITLENEKENTGSDLESLLVSSIRYDQQNLMAEGQHQIRSKPSQGQQSLIKKQYLSNVYIQENSERKCYHCEKRIDSLNESITLLSLKMQELQSKLSICFGKYGKMQTKTTEFQLFIEEYKHAEMGHSEHIKTISAHLAKMQEENRCRMKEREEQQNRIRKALNRLENKQNDRVCYESKMIQHKLQRYKDEQQFKMREIIETLEKIGNLQHKMVENSQKNEDSLEQAGKKKYFRTFSGSDKARTNYSTNISYSRNYEFPK